MKTISQNKFIICLLKCFVPVVIFLVFICSLTWFNKDCETKTAKYSSCHCSLWLIRPYLLNQNADSPLVNCITLLIVCSAPNETRQWQCSLWPFTKSMKSPLAFPLSLVCCHINSNMFSVSKYGTLFFVLHTKCK